MELYNWFFSLYEKQTCEIDFILSEWPNIVCEETLTTISKQEYLKNGRKIKEGLLTGICERQNYQMLIRR